MSMTPITNSKLNLRFEFKTKQSYTESDEKTRSWNYFDYAF